MKKRILSLCMAAVLALSCILPASAAETQSGLTVRSVTPADLSQTMGNTTQQMTAQPQNPNEVVDILVELDDESAAAVLAAQSLTPGTAAAEKTAARVQQNLLRRQATVQSRLDRSLRQEQVDYTYSYTMLFNGFALRTARKNLETIQSTKGVSRAFVAGSYTLPTVEQADTQALQVTLATNQFTGKGMTIAVLDTGLDTAHPAFANAPADAKFTKDYVSGILQAADLNAETLMPGVTADDVYLSAKIPFAFDYAGKDAQVAPGSKWQAQNLEHGTHVAGISAGYAVDGEGAVTFSGVAPDAQVIPMKVFDDSGTGAATTTILAALEDACRLGVDAVNLSLGSYCGFTVDEDALINDVYNKLDDAGIMVITAAGNETSSSYMNSYGTDAPLTGDPDNSVVAAPSVYPANLSIASVEGQEIYANYALLGDEKITYTDSQTSFLGLESYISLLKAYGDVPADLAAPYDYVMVPGYGANSDYEGIDVTGKIAVVQRGGTNDDGEPITFVDKIQNALWKNAIGILVYNNDTEHPDDYSIRMATNYYQLPAAFISYNAAQKLAAKAGSGVGITPTTELTAETNPSAGQMSTFTSIGATPDLRIKPELSAIGGNVYSSIPTVEDKGDYASMSGTSMASPYVAGASVLVKSYMAENWTGSYDAASMTENLMMSTASPVIDPETKLPYSPRLQGSGLIDLSAATSSDVVLYTDADQYGDTKPVLNLGDDVARNGSYDLTFHARNMGKDAAQYDVSVIAMSPAVLTQDGKTYMSSHDEALDVTVSGDKTVTLAAGATGDVKVSVSLSADQKAKLDAAYENGIYVEGFVVLTAKNGGADLSIPFLAYYGDWSAPGMLDYATMLNEDTVPYSQLSTELGAYFTSQFAYRLGANLAVTVDEAPNTSLKAEHLTISPNGDQYMDGVEMANVSQMRNAVALHFTVTNADGQEVWNDTVTSVPKTIYVSSQGGPIPATMYQDMAPEAWYGTDNEGNALPDGQYYYTITADPVTDHESRNVRDTLTFPVYIDTQAPQLDEGRVTLNTDADGRTTLGMQVSDEHLYLDTEIFVANDDGTISTSSEKLLHKNVGLADMPDVTSDAVSVDVTDYAGKLLYVQLSDWGYNHAAYLVQLPETFESTTLTLSDTTASLFTGEQQQLVAFDTDTDTALTWTSSNADVASVDDSGLVTANAPGVTTVTATTANGASASCVVGVSDQLTYTGLRLDFDEMTTTMYFDSTIDLPGVYLEPYGFALSGKHNTYGTEGLTWSVSDPTIADLDEYSKTTLVANKDGKSGDVTVTAEYQGMTASFTVHVGPYPGSVELYHGWIQARSNRIFLQGKQGKQGVVGVGRDGIHVTDTAATSDDQIITFTNSDPNVVELTNPVIRATSNRDMADECAFVDARNPGNAVITATATSTTQDTVQCFVTVVPKWYDGIQATQDTIHLKLGQGADLTQYLTLLDESGVVIPELNPVNYTSLDESILSVDETGHVTALHTGTGMVLALLNTGDYALIAVEVTCDHDHTTRTETPATCTDDGSVTVICDDCGEVLSTETLPATGHTTVVKNAKDATCTEPGYTGDEVCTACGETIKTGEVIPAAGHSYKDGKCTVCGAADPNANSGGNTGNTGSPNTADGAAMGLWLSLMTVAALAGAVLVLGKRYRA